MEDLVKATLTGSNLSIPEEFLLPPALRIDVANASDEEIFNVEYFSVVFS